MILVVDNVAEFQAELEQLNRTARQRQWPLLIIGGVRINEWNISLERTLDQYVDEKYAVSYLSRIELQELIRKLDQFDCLGELKGLTEEQRLRRLMDEAGRQLLVALHEATKNDSFSAIVKSEYNGISPEEAKILYLDICAMHRFGSPVRAGLISRLHNIDYDTFKRNFFQPLEDIIDLKIDPRTHDYSYHARHPVVAEMVYSSVLQTTEAQFENTLRLIVKLNTSYAYDQEVMARLTRAATMADIFKDRSKGSAIYDAAIRSGGKTSYLLHQRGLYEMRLGGDTASFNRAEAYFEEALELEAYQKITILHSLAELCLARSKIAEAEVERAAWRNKAIEQASALIGKAGGSYAYHTIIKCRMLKLRDQLDKVPETGMAELAREANDRAVKEVEDTIQAALRKFPGDAHILRRGTRISPD